MEEAAVYATLTDVFHDVFFDDGIKLRPDMTADDVEGWDSMSHVNLIVAVESRFAIRFDTAELESLHTVGDMAAIIQRKAA